MGRLTVPLSDVDRLQITCRNDTGGLCDSTIEVHLRDLDKLDRCPVCKNPLVRDANLFRRLAEALRALPNSPEVRVSMVFPEPS